MGFFSPHSRFDSAMSYLEMLRSSKETQMNFASARPALAGTHYLQMKKIQDWQCLRDDFPSLVVELVGAGFLCPLIWYIAALLYYCKYYNRDPRERPGLAASAFLAVIFTAATIVTLSVLLIIIYGVRFA
uniref:Uncharacterized protein n=1 Tax=Oryza barthii TaxID=65489 RepID=A0A0D3G3X7_9ORYZ